MKKTGKNRYYVPGFRAGAVKAGVRYKNRLDLGIIIADGPVPSAGIFTNNRVKAPSVISNRTKLRGGLAQAVLVNSGNANTCVGPRGKEDVKKCADAVANKAGIKTGLVLTSSTGVIGEPLNTKNIIEAVPSLIAAAGPYGFEDFSRAIMTTDTFAKVAIRKVRTGTKTATIVGTAKGAGMIMPNMATMLAYVLTDAEMSPEALRHVLDKAARDSFNAVTVDGDTSTSDTLIMMASGKSGAAPDKKASTLKSFQEAVNDLCLELAKSIAKDGEGATKMFEVTVTGAKSFRDADKVARRIANSPLVKTAFHAGDPNWGRVMMAVGSAGVAIQPDRIGVRFELGKKMVSVVEKGACALSYSEKKAAEILAGDGFRVAVDLGQGNDSRTIYTCDLSADYVRINADYRS